MVDTVYQDIVAPAAVKTYIDSLALAGISVIDITALSAQRVLVIVIVP